MPEKRYLFTPGPTPVPPQVLAAVGSPVVHHRSPDFRQTYSECLARSKEVFRTESDVLLYSASGTGVFESAVSNLTRPGERAVVVSHGYFGERWVAMAKAFGVDLVHLRCDWGDAPHPDELRSTLEDAGGASVVYLTHSETSTGVVADVEALAAVAREAGAIVVVDAVSSLGAIPLETDAWEIDVAVSASQKALMTPPGVGLVAISPRALDAAGRTPTGRFYFDWERTRKGQEALDAPVTLAVSLVAGLNVAMSMILEEGLEAVFDRHRRLGRACREGAKAMGLELFSPDDDSAAVVTAIHVPPGIDAADFLLTLRDRLGIQLIGGQGELKGKIFRIGHIGWFDIFDIVTALAGVELVLAEAGADIERGVAVTRALETYESTRV